MPKEKRDATPLFRGDYSGGFIAGTRVHTKSGLVPIEQIQINDFVLSQAESGGEMACRRVMNTFKYVDKTILKVEHTLDDGDRETTIFATSDQPFWVVGQEWKKAGAIEPGDEVRLLDQKQAIVNRVLPVYRTEKPHVGWVPEYQDLEWGYEKNFMTNEHTWKVLAPDSIYDQDDPWIKVPVYNLEVEGFHNYCIGFGVSVHDNSVITGTPGQAIVDL